MPDRSEWYRVQSHRYRSGIDYISFCWFRQRGEKSKKKSKNHLSQTLCHARHEARLPTPLRAPSSNLSPPSGSLSLSHSHTHTHTHTLTSASLHSIICMRSFIQNFRQVRFSPSLPPRALLSHRQNSHPHPHPRSPSFSLRSQPNLRQAPAPDPR
jgi:hypothetical protein